MGKQILLLHLFLNPSSWRFLANISSLFFVYSSSKPSSAHFSLFPAVVESLYPVPTGSKSLNPISGESESLNPGARAALNPSAGSAESLNPGARAALNPTAGASESLNPDLVPKANANASLESASACRSRISLYKCNV